MGRRILIGGSFGMGNTGDEAILKAMIEAFRSHEPDLYIQVIAGNVDRIHNEFYVDAVIWNSWADIFEAAKRADMLIQGGGGIFFDYGDFDPRSLFRNGAPNLNHYASFSLMATLLDKKLMIFACGVGPLLSEMGREMVRVAFDQAHRTTIRDEGSKALLQNIGVNPEALEVTADPAALLPTAGAELGRDYLKARGIALERPLIGLVVRQWDEYAGTVDWHSTLVEQLLPFVKQVRGEVILLPFHPGYDAEVQATLAHRLDLPKPAIIQHESDPMLVASVMSNCSLVVGMRLHSVLFSIMLGIPVVALEYAPKVRSLMRRVGYEDLCLSLPDLSGLASVLERAWEAREQIREDFLAASGELKRQAYRNIELAMNLLDTDLPKRETLPGFIRMLAHAVEGRLDEIRRYEHAVEQILLETD